MRRLILRFSKSGNGSCRGIWNWLPAINVYRRNFKHEIYKFDLSNTQEAANHIKSFKPDIIAGGPPCQDFSSAGKRDENGGRGDLTLDFAAIVTQVNPTWFIMENVDRIKKTIIFKQAKKIFANNGYGLTEVILDASLCGVPQKRKRMFLIGRKGEQNNFLQYILTSKLRRKNLTVEEFFGDSLDTKFYYRHARSYERRAIFSVKEPSPTIRGVNRPIPPKYKFHKGDATKNLGLVRPLTTIERAQIQTFPKSFKWIVSNKSDLEQMIGNAVPVNLAKFVGEAIMQWENTNEQHKLIAEPVFEFAD